MLPFPKKEEINLQKRTVYNGCSKDGSACSGTGSGTLPACAPLAVPYVPFQDENPEKYEAQAALSNGTLFPGLNLPFRLKVDAPEVANTPLAELQALNFVLNELGLYLDTHCDDAEAFALYQSYRKLEQEGRAAYVAKYGPLTQMDTAEFDRYIWLNDPWPWEGGND